MHETNNIKLESTQDASQFLNTYIQCTGYDTLHYIVISHFLLSDYDYDYDNDLGVLVII